MGEEFVTMLSTFRQLQVIECQYEKLMKNYTYSQNKYKYRKKRYLNNHIHYTSKVKFAIASCC